MVQKVLNRKCSRASFTLDHERDLACARLVPDGDPGDHVVRLVDLKASPRLAFYIGSQMTACAGSVQEDLIVCPDIQKRHTIRITILAHGREPPGISALKRSQRLLACCPVGSP
jgi:hypothetical protein